MYTERDTKRRKMFSFEYSMDSVVKVLDKSMEKVIAQFTLQNCTWANCYFSISKNVRMVTAIKVISTNHLHLATQNKTFK